MAGVIVWEWQNEFGTWRPYSPQIVAYLESNKASPTPLQLGTQDQSLVSYCVDIQNLVQLRIGTGDVNCDQ